MAYNDELMVFDEATDRYKLTEAALLNSGIDIRARYTAAGMNDGGAAVNALLTMASDLVYNYAHNGVYDTEKQDYVLNNYDGCRKNMYRALLAMAVSLARYGNRLDSVEEAERAVAIPSQVKAEFNVVIPDLGHTLNYSGRW